MANKPVKRHLVNPFKTREGKIVIIQIPNLALVIVFALWFADRLLSEQQDFLQYFGAAALLYWAALEIKSGVNIWRRILSSAIAINTVINLIK